LEAIVAAVARANGAGGEQPIEPLDTLLQLSRHEQREVPWRVGHAKKDILKGKGLGTGRYLAEDRE